LERINSQTTTNLTAECRHATRSGNWILFVIEADLLSDPISRRYFRTASEPYGLFIEYDPTESGLLRLGLGLGPEKWNSGIPIRFVRRDERSTILIGVTRSETRVVSNVVDFSVDWPGHFGSQWRCDDVRGGYESSGSEGRCPGCDESISYITGERLDDLKDIMDAASNVRRFNVLRYLGNSLSLLGLGFIALALRRRAIVNDA
jgi:hypothetical protein